jgi:hypothetical protein
MMDRARLSLRVQVLGLSAMVAIAAISVREAQGSGCLHQGRPTGLCPITQAPQCDGATDCKAARGWANQQTNVWSLAATRWVPHQYFNPAPNDSAGTISKCYEIYHCIVNPATGDCQVDLTDKIQDSVNTAYPDVHC